jgi:hypothetical protein
LEAQNVYEDIIVIIISECIHKQISLEKKRNFREIAVLTPEELKILQKKSTELKAWLVELVPHSNVNLSFFELLNLNSIFKSLVLRLFPDICSSPALSSSPLSPIRLGGILQVKILTRFEDLFISAAVEQMKVPKEILFEPSQLGDCHDLVFKIRALNTFSYIQQKISQNGVYHDGKLLTLFPELETNINDWQNHFSKFTAEQKDFILTLCCSLTFIGISDLVSRLVIECVQAFLLFKLKPVIPILQPFKPEDV